MSKVRWSRDRPQTGNGPNAHPEELDQEMAVTSSDRILPNNKEGKGGSAGLQENDEETRRPRGTNSSWGGSGVDGVDGVDALFWLLEVRGGAVPFSICQMGQTILSL